MNPYQVPGLARPDRPLCPFQVPDHEQYYVSVDNTQRAYEQFQREIGDLRHLSTEGRLVVVSGRERCGKSALINRCAYWLRRELNEVELTNEVKLKGVIFPLTDVIGTTRSVKERIPYVLDCMIEDLGSLKLLKDHHLDKLKTLKSDMNLAFRYLSKNLDENRILIILLPPSAELVQEMEKYAELAQGKIVFFSESAYVDNVRRQWSTIREASRMEPILLEVGPLEERDGWLFADARQKKHAGQPGLLPFPRMTEDTMVEITSGLKIAIGQLQLWLHDYYHYRSQLPQDNVTPVGEVTFEDFTKFYYWYSQNGTRYPQ